MKKKLLIAASMMAVMALSVGFTACNNTDDSSTSVQTPAEDKVTVTFYDGTTELKSEEIDKGGKVAE
jgi:major membrane immunogen (membrane-anchored lipoprotein)